jgi:ATP-dependent DNA helicase PIF1
MRLILGVNNTRFGEWIRNLFYNSAMYGRILLLTYIYITDSAEIFFYKIYLIEQMQLQDIIRDTSFFRDRVILTIKNDTVADINVRILTRLTGETRVYDIVDSINFNTMEKEGNRPDIFIEFLRAQNPSGLPPARLELKIGTPIICFRNLFPKEGLYNGTRIIITKLREYSIKIKIINSQFYGKDRMILRITLIADMGKGAWKYSRKQFPVRLYFAITINKTQGQSLQKIGINLRQPVFIYGQFYVAFSRVTDVANLYVLLPYRGSGIIKNIVYPEVLLR